MSDPTGTPFHARRRAAVSSVGDAVRVEPLVSGIEAPALVRPAVDGLELAAWVAANAAEVERRLIERGALLFRGFEVGGAEGFERAAAALSGSLLDYRYRSTPRSTVRGRVFTSTEYPADQWIPEHNENAYSRTWPMKLWFACETAAREGGDTPVVDSRRVYGRIDPDVRDRFAGKRLTYVRNFGAGLDLDWRTVFQTGDRAEVDAYCRDAGIEAEWRGGDRLRTRQTCDAVAVHPRTGEAVWFNQAHLFHPSALPEAVRRSLVDVVGEDDLPRSVRFGDGTPIPDETLDAIREIYRDESIRFAWREGDVLLLDNMLFAHGRAPYVGPRKILVAMAEPYGPGVKEAHA